MFVCGELLSVWRCKLFSYHLPEYFSLLDRTVEIEVDFGPIPRFGYKTLKENERYKIIIDPGGIKKKVIKGRQFGMPQFLEWPVKDEEDWKKVEKRFKPADPRRYPLDWDGEEVNIIEGRLTL